ncbi:MAG: response regulator [Nitrospinae bacterium]|nr:response regulator [Nitrospinota bacterium]
MPINSVLVVDDEPDVLEITAHFLHGKGFDVARATNGADALRLAAGNVPDVVLLDISMPGMDGIAVLKELRVKHPSTEAIMITAHNEVATAITCMQEGAYGYLVKPLDFNQLHLEVSRALEHRRMALALDDFHKNLELKVEERAGEVRRLNEKLRENFLASVRVLMSLLEVYEPYMGSHLKRVGALAVEMGRALNLPEREREDLEIAALLHDIGRVALPDEHVHAGFNELPAEHISYVKQHTVIAQHILSPSGELENAGKIIRSMHEHLDGSGFPDELRDDDIPRLSRILGVINAYDELVHRRRFTHEHIGSHEEGDVFALRHLYSVAGRHFERRIIEALEKVLEDVRIRERNEVRLTVRELKPGMQLARDIYTHERLLLLGKGSTLTSLHIKRIEAFCRMKMVNNEFFTVHGGIA